MQTHLKHLLQLLAHTRSALLDGVDVGGVAVHLLGPDVPERMVLQSTIFAALAKRELEDESAFVVFVLDTKFFEGSIAIFQALTRARAHATAPNDPASAFGAFTTSLRTKFGDRA